MVNVYDEKKWGVLVEGPCEIFPYEIFPCESFKFASEWASKFNDWIVRRIIPESQKDDPIMFASLFMWDSKEHGEHDPSEVDWDNPM